MHGYSGITHTLASNTTKWSVLGLSGKWDSNPRLQPWQGRALPTGLFPQNCKPLTLPRKPRLRTRTMSMVLTYHLLKVETDAVWSRRQDPSITPPEETNCLCSSKTLSRSALVGRDSNPRTRMGADLQSAAFSHFATYQYICAYLSERRDSNPRSRPWQGHVLPTELLSHMK